MSYRFENLEIWKLARHFVNLIYTVTGRFPRHEIFCLTNQLRRASLSIMLNIAEGSDRYSDIEFIRFLRIAHTSLEEVISGMFVAIDQNYIDEKVFNEIYNESELIAKKIFSLINYLKKKT